MYKDKSMDDIFNDAAAGNVEAIGLRPPVDTHIKLSVVIATYNRAGTLVTTLDALTGQTLPMVLWEIVVVDNNSPDDTRMAVDNFAAAHPELNIRVVTEKRQGVSHARNRGIEESVGEYIVVIDDDEQAVPRFLEEYYNLFEGMPDVMAAGGRIIPKYTSPIPRWLSPRTERPIAGTVNFGRKIKPIPEGKFFGGGNHGVRRLMFERYGVYNTELGRTGKDLLAGEEKELYARFKAAGAKMYYLPEAIIYHNIEPERLTPEYFKRLCYRIGRSERVRTLGLSRGAYRKRLLSEAVKWCAAIVLSLGYLITLRPDKGWYLLVMRAEITRGLLSDG